MKSGGGHDCSLCCANLPISLWVIAGGCSIGCILCCRAIAEICEKVEFVSSKFFRLQGIHFVHFVLNCFYIIMGDLFLLFLKKKKIYMMQK